MSDKDLPELTEKQFEFVNKILEGKTASDAYRHAYNVENMTDRSIWASASRLKADDKVSSWLEFMTSDRVEMAVRTKEERIARMERLVMMSEKTGNMGAAVAAEEKAGKLEGHYINLSQSVASRTDELAILKDIASDGSKESIAFAMKEAKGLGLEKELKKALGTLH